MYVLAKRIRELRHDKCVWALVCGFEDDPCPLFFLPCLCSGANYSSIRFTASGGRHNKQNNHSKIAATMMMAIMPFSLEKNAD